MVCCFLVLDTKRISTTRYAKGSISVDKGSPKAAQNHELWKNKAVRVADTEGKKKLKLVDLRPWKFEKHIRLSSGSSQSARSRYKGLVFAEYIPYVPQLYILQDSNTITSNLKYSTLPLIRGTRETYQDCVRQRYLRGR